MAVPVNLGIIALISMAVSYSPELDPIVPPQSATWHDRFSIGLGEAIGDGPTRHPDPLQQGPPHGH